MGYTNKTTHYELPQYVATDKPKYLTDFNETMQAIDTQMYTNAEAAATADAKAVAAKDVADGAVESIGTLNVQINGDPEDPTDTGLNGQVSDNKTDIETVQELIGTGTPTTSNQTIIGAINGLEGAVAPREDGADLANSYTTGQQFARGGSIFTALTDLTAGTAFASLTLNTDYKNSDTLVEQISNASAAIADKVGAYKNGSKVSVSVTADGVKAYTALLDELFALLNTSISALNANDIVTALELHIPALGDMCALETKVAGGASHNHYHFNAIFPISNTIYIRTIDMRATNTNVVQSILDSATLATTNEGNTVPSEGAVIKVDYIPLISLSE